MQLDDKLHTTEGKRDNKLEILAEITRLQQGLLELFYLLIAERSESLLAKMVHKRGNGLARLLGDL